MSVLPEGAKARQKLKDEAIEVGMAQLSAGMNIMSALYEVYQHFRMKFLSEMDQNPQVWDVGKEKALMAARELEAFVNETWKDSILNDSALIGYSEISSKLLYGPETPGRRVVKETSDFPLDGS